MTLYNLLRTHRRARHVRPSLAGRAARDGGDEREKIDAALGDATPQARRKLLFENSAKLYEIAPPDVPPPVPVG